LIISGLSAIIFFNNVFDVWNRLKIKPNDKEIFHVKKSLFLLVRSQRKIVLMLLMLIGLFLTNGACWGARQDATAATPPKIRIGALLPLTGSVASIGKESLATLNIAKTDFEATYPGNSIELVIADTGSNDATALVKIKAFYEQGIRIVIGPYTSSEILTVKEFADAHGMIIISPTGTATILHQDDHVIRLTLDNAKQAEAMAALLRNQAITHVIAVWINNLYGRDLYNAFKDQLVHTKTQLVDTVRYEPDAADYHAIVAALNSSLQKIENTVNPKHIGILLIGYDEAINLMKTAAANQLLVGVKWFGTDGLAKRALLIDDGVAAEFAAKTEFTASIEDQQAFMMPVSPFSYLEEHLINKLIAKGEPTDPTVYYTYDSFMLGALTLAKMDPKLRETADLKAAVIARAKVLQGNNVRLTLDECGDIINGSFGFYKVKRSDSGYYWTLTAAYPFRLKTGTPHPSQTLFYREFDRDLATKEMVIGTLMPVTGKLSYRGVPALKTINQAKIDIEQVFKSYYQNAPTLRLVQKDTKSDPQIALQELRALKAQGVNLVIGPMSTEEVIAVQQYANENQMLLISPTCTAPSLAQADNIFRLSLNDTRQAQALAAFCAHEGLQDVMVLMSDNQYANDLYASFKTACQTIGANVEAPIVYSKDTKDFKPYLSLLNQKAQIIKTDKSAVLLIAFDEATSILEGAGAYSQLASLRWMGTDSIALSSDLFKSVKAASFAGKTGFTASIMSSPVSESIQSNSTATDVIYHDLCAAIGQGLNSMDTNSYDALWTFALMYVNQDWQFNGFNDYQQALLAVTDRLITINGSVKFDANGDRMVGNIAFYRVVARKDASYSWKMTGSYFSSMSAAKTKYFAID
jgi:branched-chain amino acid transport system substrate-binding protein